MHKDNGVTVGFANLDTKGENGETISTVGYANGEFRANSVVTIHSKINDDSCGIVDCTLGANVAIGNDKKLPAQFGGVIDTILPSQKRYKQGGNPMGPNNRGPNIVNGVTLTPKASVPH